MPRLNNITTVFLAVFCLAMLVIVAVEQLPPRNAERTPPAAAGASPTVAVTNPTPNFQVSPLEHYKGVVERPLFMQDRRPPPAEETVEAPPPEEPKDDVAFTLTGVMIMPQLTVAFLHVEPQNANPRHLNPQRPSPQHPNPQDKPVRLKAGDQLEGWLLESIQPDKVSLRRGERVINVPLIRNKPTGGDKHPPVENRRQPVGKRDNVTPNPAIPRTSSQ